MPNPVTEFRGKFHDVLVISELRGAYPNVPISSDVDYESLIAGDSSPVFLTLPIAKVNAKSGNGRFYDEAFVTELMRQTLANKPVGLFGHLSEAERSTSFKPEVAHWIGAVRDGDLVWGKAYLVGEEARARVKRYKSTGKTIATSIDAYAEGVWSDVVGGYHMDAATLRLNQIDLAPSDRAGIPDLARVPVLTTEMQDIQAPTVEQEFTEMDKLQLIRELTADDARLLPKNVRDAVIGQVRTAPEVATVAQIRETLGLTADADPIAAIAEMRNQQAQQAKATVTNRITELVSAGIKAEAMRPLVTELVTSRNPATVADAETAYNAVVASDSVKAMLAAHVQTTMGPPQRTPVQGQQSQNRYFQIPTQAEA